jgi:hypothetical protein
MAFLVIPPAYSYNPSDEARASDNFVRMHGIFHHNFIPVKDFRLFRTEYKRDCDKVSFLYVALAYSNGRMMSGRFVVTVNTEDLSILSVRPLPKSSVLGGYDFLL